MRLLEYILFNIPRWYQKGAIRQLNYLGHKLIINRYVEYVIQLVQHFSFFRYVILKSLNTFIKILENILGSFRMDEIIWTSFGNYKPREIV